MIAYPSEVDRLTAENERLWRAVSASSSEIEQRIANLFPDEFPHYPDDWPGGGPNGNRCVGDHTPETMVMRACREIERLRAEAS